jgi:hypothetical protein
MRYDVSRDIATVDRIIESFAAAPPTFHLAPTSPGFATESPIFVVGLPRSGSILADRILGRHSRVVAAAGELKHFSLSVVTMNLRDSEAIFLWDKDPMTEANFQGGSPGRRTPVY